MRPVLCTLIAVITFLSTVTVIKSQPTNLPSAKNSANSQYVSSHRISLTGSQIEVKFAPGQLDLSEEEILDWIKLSSQAVELYYGTFPVKQVTIVVKPTYGRGVKYGTADGHGRPLINVYVGSSSKAEDLEDDWVMVHEMVHLGFPSLRDRHNWMEEGMATYIEPIARARVGLVSEEEVWGDLVRNLPQGQPKDGDKGLDYTPSWGRIYWGGALFCLVADVEIRQKTKNRKGLEQAMRGIVAAGGTITALWDADRAFETGDKAVGVQVMKNLYDSMKATPVTVDLQELWNKLGVEVRGRRVVFNNRAPLAHIRKAITALPKEDL
ncbi:MAG: hypothetical protein JNN15_18960 [Blastocatellia bacterium]|nr:hypothetical protein [Blastocatellia bacterium]